LYKKKRGNRSYIAAIYTRRGEGMSLWVVPSTAIVASSPEDMGSFFEPSNDKIYRHPTFYQIPDGVGHM
jgi:ring-1,2-phenylacetyl-CoA epoxidase subunit PaaB